MENPMENSIVHTLATRIFGRDKIARLKHINYSRFVENRLKTAGLLGANEKADAYTLARALGTQTRFKYSQHRKILESLQDLNDIEGK